MSADREDLGERGAEAGTALLRAALGPAERALNGALAGDPVTLARTAALADRSVLVRSVFSLRIGFSAEGFRFTALPPGDEGPADLVVSGSPRAFVETLRQRRPDRELRLDGDAELMAELAGILSDMEPDPLALLPTDVASTLSLAARRARSFLDELGRGFREAAADTPGATSPDRAGDRLAAAVRRRLDLPDATEAEQLYRQIEDLRFAVDRLEARAAAVEVRRGAPSASGSEQTR